MIGLAAGVSIVLLLIFWKRVRKLFWVSMVLGPAAIFLADF